MTMQVTTSSTGETYETYEEENTTDLIAKIDRYGQALEVIHEIDAELNLNATELRTTLTGKVRSIGPGADCAQGTTSRSSRGPTSPSLATLFIQTLDLKM